MIILKNNKQKNNIFVLKKKIRETSDVLTLKFSPIKGSVFSFKPGQFVLVSFLDDRCGGQGKSYSISSCPGEKFLTITVKKVGKFSGALHDLKIGKKAKISPPQGYFCLEDEMKDIVFLAGGIGITPFYSIIKSFSNKINGNIFLFYSNKTKNGAAFSKELNDLADNREKLKIIYTLTREKTKIPGAKNCEFGRINVKMIKKYLKDLKNKHYFICGSIEFVNDLWQALGKNGIGEDFIKTEVFY